MTKEKKWGIFVSIGVILLFLVFFLFGEVKLFREGYNIYVKYNFTGGLSENAPVRLAGVNVGNVEKVKMQYTQKEQVYILVKLWIKEDIKFRENARFYINTLGLLGEKYVEISPGSSKAPYLPENATVVGVDPLSTEELYSKGKALADDLQEILKTLRRLLNEETFEVLVDSFKSVENVMNQLDIMLKENRSNIKRTTDNFRKSSESLPEIAGNLRNISDELDKGFEGKSQKISKIIENVDKIARNLEKLSKNMEEMGEGKGTAGKLMKNEEVYNNINEASKELKDLIEDIKKNPKKYFELKIF
ncbi:MAG: MCE family protein [Candidatus Mcinerneyibacterium aminivorans]|uniref:MCE family protein n=1 Tax=Candidatus Mcinerneyibacterium aminivorans TaxID=2703815 RepID=A0A5D0MGH9_9BACT|nr:MAG: MCE family protein [Candidatus Mcinerneyibacterium aminivorans]